MRQNGKTRFIDDSDVINEIAFFHHHVFWLCNLTSFITIISFYDMDKIKEILVMNGKQTNHLKIKQKYKVILSLDCDFMI